MLNAFRLSNEISQDRDIYLLFDGERLEPTMLVGATELSDMDNIEVYIK